MRRRLAGPVPAGRVHDVAEAFVVTDRLPEQQSVGVAVGLAVRLAGRFAVALGAGIGVATTTATFAVTSALPILMLQMSTPESAFLDSVERRKPGTSLRGYVTRTLPTSSPIIVANRAPHVPRPEGGFARGAGGVLTALLTFAEVAGAEWVACAPTELERGLV